MQAEIRQSPLPPYLARHLSDNEIKLLRKTLASNPDLLASQSPGAEEQALHVKIRSLYQLHEPRVHPVYTTQPQALEALNRLRDYDSRTVRPLHADPLAYEREGTIYQLWIFKDDAHDRFLFCLFQFSAHVG